MFELNFNCATLGKLAMSDYGFSRIDKPAIYAGSSYGIVSGVDSPCAYNKAVAFIIWLGQGYGYFVKNR